MVKSSSINPPVTGIASASRVLMLEHSIYSVISPEGAAGILWRDGARARDHARCVMPAAQRRPVRVLTSTQTANTRMLPLTIICQ